MNKHQRYNVTHLESKDEKKGIWFKYFKSTACGEYLDMVQTTTLNKLITCKNCKRTIAYKGLK